MKKSLLLSIVLVLTGLNSFSQWESQSSGITFGLSGVYFTDTNTGYAVGGGLGPGGGVGIILKTINGGTDWTTQWSGITPMYSVYFPDTNTGYVVGHFGNILKTINGGTDWTAQSSGTANDLVAVYFTDVNTGYTVGDAGRILKTINGGASWTHQSSGTTWMLRSVYFTDASTGIAVGGDYSSSIGVILKTSNGGSTWTTISNDYMLWSVYFPTVDTGYAVGDDNGSGLIVRTTDGGTTWSTLNVTCSTLRGVCFPKANTGYAVGSDGTIIITSDAGKNWAAQESGSTNWLYSVYFLTSDTGYAVGNGGTIVKTTNGGGPPVGIIEKQQTNYLKIYPNPASDKMIIEPSESGSNMNGTLSIYGMTGQELIKQQVQDSKAEINVSSLPQGIYFIKLANKKKIESGNFVKN